MRNFSTKSISLLVPAEAGNPEGNKKQMPPKNFRIYETFMSVRLYSRLRLLQTIRESQIFDLSAEFLRFVQTTVAENEKYQHEWVRI